MKKIDFRIPIIIVLTIILIIMCYFYFKEDSPNNFFNDSNREISNTENVKKSYTVQTTSEIKSALTENIELHATYYLEESYVNNFNFCPIHIKIELPYAPKNYDENYKNYYQKISDTCQKVFK